MTRRFGQKPSADTGLGLSLLVVAWRRLASLRGPNADQEMVLSRRPEVSSIHFRRYSDGQCAPHSGVAGSGISGSDRTMLREAVAVNGESPRRICPNEAGKGAFTHSDPPTSPPPTHASTRAHLARCRLLAAYATVIIASMASVRRSRYASSTVRYRGRVPVH